MAATGSPPNQAGLADKAGSVDKVCLAAVAGAHGVRGLVRLKTFTERPEDVAAYGALSDEAGTRSFRLTLKGWAKDLPVVAIAGVNDRNAAQALRGTRLYVARAALPPPDEEEAYYHADLLGLAVEDMDGRPLGRVRAIYDFGAGDLLEVAGPDGRVRVLPFTKAVVPVVDLDGGRLVADPPAEVGEPEPKAPEDGAGTGQSGGKTP